MFNKVLLVTTVIMLLTGCASEYNSSLDKFDGMFFGVRSECSNNAGVVVFIEHGRLVGAINFNFYSPGVATISDSGLLTVVAPGGCISQWQRQTPVTPKRTRR